MIVILLNSSVAAEAARGHYAPPSTMKAYGDPHDLASDTNVDLAIFCTQVNIHSATTRSDVSAGEAICKHILKSVRIC
ncbi:hypothetical protein F4804DRAFT_309957 [Jackrogersella minutella]|nr:hypothetical protein F4804DRAFT_309957 [Jackrogersella minutella]